MLMAVFYTPSGAHPFCLVVGVGVLHIQSELVIEGTVQQYERMAVTSVQCIYLKSLSNL